jgi:hypothetical protein
MKNKNTTLIKNIRRMINQPAMQGPQHQGWRESWLYIIKALERGEEV